MTDKKSDSGKKVNKAQKKNWGKHYKGSKK